MANADNDDMPKEIKIYKIGKFLYSYRNFKIYAGTNSFTKEEVTIKTINKKYIQGNPKSLAFLNNDVLFTKILSHNNILRLLETYETPYYVFIIMENFKGEFLSSFMNRHKKLEESKALNIFSKIISAMVYIHNMKICHLNINLESILIDENDDNLIKIYDFKYGQYYYTGFKTISDNLGTSMFTCPEMFSIDSYFPELADVWSCGIILCYLLTGEFPINPDKELDLEERYILPNNISKDLHSLLKKILEFDIDKRYKFNDILCSKYFSTHNYETEINEEINNSYNIDDINLRKIYERYLKQKVRLGKEDHPDALINLEILIKRENLPDNKRMSKLIEMFGKVEDTNANLVPKRKNVANNKKKDKNSEKKENEQKLINNSEKKENNSLPVKKKDTFTNFKFNKDKVALRTNKLKGGIFKKGVKGKRKSFFDLYNRYSKKSFLFEIPESLITEREAFNNFNQFQAKIQENISNDFVGRNYLKKNTNVVNNFKFLGPKISSSVGRRRKSQFTVVGEKYADFELFTKINNEKKLKKIEEEKKDIISNNNNNEDENINSINESTKNLYFNSNNNKPVFNFDEIYEEGEESDKNKSFNSNSEGKENGNLNEDNINISKKSSHLNNNESNVKSINDNNANNLNNINNNINEPENNMAKSKYDNENKSIRYISNNLFKINKTDKKDKKNDNKDEKIMTNYKTKNFNKTSLKDNKNKQLLIYSYQKTDRTKKILNKNNNFENNLKNSIKNNYLANNKKRKINEEKNNKEISNSFNQAQNSRLFNSKLDKYKKAAEDNNKTKKSFYNGKMTLNKSSDNITKRDNIRKNNNKNLKINTKLIKNSSLPTNEPKTPTLQGENQNETDTNKIISKIFENTNSLFFNKDQNLITKNINDEDGNLSPHFFSKNQNVEKKRSILSQNNHYTSNYFYQKGNVRPSLVSFSSQVVVYSDDSDEEEDEATREEKKLRRKIHNIQMMNNLKATKLEGEKVIIKKFTSKAKTPDHKGIFKKPTSLLARTKTKKEKVEDKSEDDNRSILESRSFISNKNSIIAKTKTEYKGLQKQPMKKADSAYDTILQSLKDLKTVVEQNEENDVYAKYMRRKITPDKSIRKIISENEDESGSHSEDENKSKRKNKSKSKLYKKRSIGSESEDESDSNSDSQSNSESNSSNSERNNSEKDTNKISDNYSNMNSDYNSINNCDSEIYDRKLQKLQNQNKTKTSQSKFIKNRILKNLGNKNNNNNVTTKSDSLSNNNSSFYNHSYRNTTNKDNDDVLNDVDNFNFINDEYNKIKTEMNKQKNTFKKHHINSKSFATSNGDKLNKTDIEISSEERNHNNYDNNKDYLSKIKENLRNKLINSTSDLSEEKVLPFNGCVIDIKYISLRNYEQTVKLLISELKRKGVRYQKIDYNTYKCTKGIRLFYVDIVKIPKNLFYYRFYTKKKFQTNFK